MDPRARLREVIQAAIDEAERLGDGATLRLLRLALPPLPGAAIADDLPEGSIPPWR